MIKYKPTYEVKILGEQVGYIENKESLEKAIKNNIFKETKKNIQNIDLQVQPEYELKLINRTLNTNEIEIANKLKENISITCKYYEIAINNDTLETTNTIEEAQSLVNYIKEENKGQELNLSILEKYTQSIYQLDTISIEDAKKDIQNKINQKLEEQKKQKEEEERINSMPNVNGIKLACLPVSGIISSRYGEKSNIRKSNHTGLDIAAKTGTEIKAVASGKIIEASFNKSYGNLVKIDHGNDVQTWYAHASKLCVNVGQEIKAGETVALVGTTGNSTGPHLHFEIRINGIHVNPQKYLYKLA